MLYLLFWLEAALVTGLLYRFIPALHPAWILPILIGAFLTFCLLFVLYLMVTSAMFSKKPPEKPSRFALLTVRLALPWFTSLLGVRLRVKGKEKLPATHAVYVANHRSAFDPVFVMSAFGRRRTAFVSKLSVAKYPFIGPYMNACGYVFIDRDSPMQSMRALQRAAKYVKESRINYGIFPEGTRSKDGRLLPFKSGAFVLAKKADVPIAVMKIEGSENALSFRFPRVTVTVLDVIPVEEVRTLTPDELSERSRAMMEAALSKKQ